jgi:hypothetical protein
MTEKMDATTGPDVDSIPQIGEDAENLDDLLQAIKEEYLYNTTVRAMLPSLS